MEHTQHFKNRIQEVLSAIVNEGKTSAQICIECDLSMSTFRNYLKYLREKQLVYICGYRTVKGINKPMALYKFGCQEDYRTEGQKNYRSRKKVPPTTVVPLIPRCDIAAQWMLNPISHEENVCQN